MNNRNNNTREIYDVLKKILSRLDKMDERFDKMDERLDKMDKRFDKRFDKIENEIVLIKKDIGSLKQYEKEMKSYQSINSKKFEKEVTKWLYNYFINKNYSSYYYIPSNEEVPRNLLNVNANTKKTLTDLDGIIIQTNLDPSKKKDSNNIKYTLHIIEAKHKMEIYKIKQKIRQMIKFYKLINKNNSNINLSKFKGCDIYLYFASPVIDRYIYDFIKNKLYLDYNKTWSKDSDKININDIKFISDIYLISNNSGELKIVDNDTF